MPRRSGIVLAGGRGERLGLGVPKARVVLDGRTLLERAVIALASVCGEVIVAAPQEVDPGPCLARRAYDAPGHAGPLAGLVPALEACRSATAAVLGVDFPLVGSELVRALLERFEVGVPRDALVLRPGGVAQPLVSVFAVSAAPALRAALESGESSLRRALARLDVAWLEDGAIACLPGGPGSLLNVNTPADLEAARRALPAAAADRP